MDDGLGAGADGERVRRLLERADGAGVTCVDNVMVPLGPDKAAREALIGELEALGDEWAPGPAAAVTARLGALVAARWADGRDPDDRVRAVGLLRAARQVPELAAGVRRDAARDLAVLLLAPLLDVPSGQGGTEALPPGLARYLPLGLPAAVQGMSTLEVLPEVVELGREVAGDAGRLPPHIEAVAAMVPLLRSAEDGNTGALADIVAALPGLLPDSGPLGGLAQALPYMLKAFDVVPSGDTPGGAPDSASAGTSDGASRGTSDGTSGAAPAHAVRPAPSTGPPGPAELEEIARSLDAPTILTEIISPGFITLDDLRALTGRTVAEAGSEDGPARAIAALSCLALGMRTGEQAHFGRALELLAQVRNADGPVDHETEWLLQATVPAVLVGSHMTGHSLQDGQTAQELIEAALGPGGLLAAGAPERPGAPGLLLMNRCLNAQFAVDRAQRERDLSALDGIRDELLALVEQETAEDSEWRGLPRIILCGLELVRVQLTADLSALRSAVDQHAAALTNTDMLPFARPLLTTMEAPLLALATHLEPDPERVRRSLASARAALDAPASVSGQRPRNRMAIALALRALHTREADPALLDEAIAELEAAEADLAAESGEARTDAADLVVPLHEQLATALAQRAGSGDPAHDDAVRDRLARALAHARRALRASADDVLLQLGAEHGLRAARAAGSLGVLAAGWAVRLGRPEEAVACLEAGRALVLHAAAAGTTVADRLEALGAYETAAAWRQATVAAGAAGPAVLDEVLHPDATGVPRLPSALRREALELVRTAPGAAGAAAGPPPPPVLGAALARCRADALVYLVPGTGDEPGAALLLRPGLGVRAVQLPGLSAAHRGPLDAFVRARVGLRRSQGSDAGDVDAIPAVRLPGRKLEKSLELLCDWAGESVMGPVLDALGLWGRALAESGLRPDGTGEVPEPVRLVVVPCGDLGVVPWQAARLRLPHEGPTASTASAADAERGDAPGHAHLCELAVVTFAASGSELVHGIRRSRLPVGQGQALVSVPSVDLFHAEDEIEALREAYYGGARVLEEDDGSGSNDLPTPAAVLEVLGAESAAADGRAAVVHLVCHGRAGTDPTRSALFLWCEDDAPAATGRLTVTTLMDTPPAGDRSGPLVVLSACETDLSDADHDEALTLTTALVHRLATDVVGSRWPVSDRVTPALMTVLHHHLNAGLAPPDALRATQRYALTPAERRPPVAGLAVLDPFLAQQDLGRLQDWAAFIHQGNPAPEPPRRDPAR
ncbi:CHAT domain-containing protein [Streptomyces sp. NPDC026672]|uniref:CHAT domain-containing protein n=1 Tax=unclassified Streptomyces TaxID=2593676 RepID=UPI0033CADBF7